MVKSGLKYVLCISIENINASFCKYMSSKCNGIKTLRHNHTDNFSLSQTFGSENLFDTNVKLQICSFNNHHN